MKVVLSADDLRIAAARGCERQIQNVTLNRKSRWGNDDSRPWQDHIEGAIGECCVAKVLNIFWDGSLGNLDAKDVGPYQVRATRHLNGRLILHKGEDKPDDAFVLARGAGLNWEVVGWCYGREGFVEEFFKAALDPNKPRPCYAVPAARLRRLSELKALLREREEW